MGQESRLWPPHCIHSSKERSRKSLETRAVCCGRVCGLGWCRVSLEKWGLSRILEDVLAGRQSGGGGDSVLGLANAISDTGTAFGATPNHVSKALMHVITRESQQNPLGRKGRGMKTCNLNYPEPKGLVDSSLEPSSFAPGAPGDLTTPRSSGRSEDGGHEA